MESSASVGISDKKAAPSKPPVTSKEADLTSNQGEKATASGVESSGSVGISDKKAPAPGKTPITNVDAGATESEKAKSAGVESSASVGISDKKAAPSKPPVTSKEADLTSNQGEKATASGVESSGSVGISDKKVAPAPDKTPITNVDAGATESEKAKAASQPNMKVKEGMTASASAAGGTAGGGPVTVPGERSLAVVTPNGPEPVVQGAVVKISWTEDPKAEMYNILLNRAPEKSWTTLAENVRKGTTTFDWTVKQDAASECWIKVEAKSALGMVSEDTNDKPFAIKARVAPVKGK